MLLTITWDHWQKQDIVNEGRPSVCKSVCWEGISEKEKMVKEGTDSKDDELCLNKLS